MSFFSYLTSVNLREKDVAKAPSDRLGGDDGHEGLHEEGRYP